MKIYATQEIAENILTLILGQKGVEWDDVKDLDVRLGFPTDHPGRGKKYYEHNEKRKLLTLASLSPDGRQDCFGLMVEMLYTGVAAHMGKEDAVKFAQDAMADRPAGGFIVFSCKEEDFREVDAEEVLADVYGNLGRPGYE